MNTQLNPTQKVNIDTMLRWQKDVFVFAEETMGMRASEPVDELKGKPIKYKDASGTEHVTMLFDADGRAVYPDLQIYAKGMFKKQDRGVFKQYHGKRFTWQQTLILEAYNRALATNGADSFDMTKRWISVQSGHGIGKTAAESVIILHFLITFFGAQIGATANSESQLKDILLKEIYFWKDRLPEHLKANITQNDDMLVIEKDWFMRARVSRPEKPEALAGLHGRYVLIVVDEASGVADMIYEVMKGALTGEFYIVLYCSNPTRTEGEFHESQKPGSPYTQLQFSSIDSPIVEEDYEARMAEEYGRESDTYRVRVLGQSASVAEMDEKGWIPLFANITILFEPERGQIIKRPIVAVDPAGKGRDSSIAGVRDSVYLKIVLDEKTSSSPDLARKIETVRDAYQAVSGDIGVDGFGIGAEVVANIQTKLGESANAVLLDKPREETKHLYHSFKAELAWRFREWVRRGGIIISNNQKAWLREMSKIKYKRDLQGRIMLQTKVEFKKTWGFSPDRFDMACISFFKELPSPPPIITKQQLEMEDMRDWIKRAESGHAGQNYSSM